LARLRFSFVMTMLSPESAPRRMFDLIRGKNVCRPPLSECSPYAQFWYSPVRLFMGWPSQALPQTFVRGNLPAS
jgi:hypothetical protein